MEFALLLETLTNQDSKCQLKLKLFHRQRKREIGSVLTSLTTITNRDKPHITTLILASLIDNTNPPDGRMRLPPINKAGLFKH